MKQLCLFQFHEIFTHIDKAIWLLYISAFSKKLGCPSSANPEILAFGSHCSANSQPILDCFIPNFKLKYEDSQNIKVDSVNRVVSTSVNGYSSCLAFSQFDWLIIGQDRAILPDGFGC